MYQRKMFRSRAWLARDTRRSRCAHLSLKRAKLHRHRGWLARAKVRATGMARHRTYLSRTSVWQVALASATLALDMITRGLADALRLQCVPTEQLASHRASPARQRPCSGEPSPRAGQRPPACAALQASCSRTRLNSDRTCPTIAEML